MKERSLYSITEARQLLGGISRNTIYGLMNGGDLASVVIGCRRFIAPAAISELISKATTTEGPALDAVRFRKVRQANPLPALSVPVPAGSRRQGTPD
jgi:hypothetical protein